MARFILTVECAEPGADIVTINDEIFAVVLPSSVKFYEVATSSLFYEIRCCCNTSAPFDFCVQDSKILVGLTGRQTGALRITTVNESDIDLSIDAAQHPLSFIRFAPDGSKVATCSEQGTIIRVFLVESGSLFAELRRGLFPASITSLSFSPSCCDLACISSNGTLHVFELSDAAAIGEKRSTVNWKMTEVSKAVLKYSENGCIFVLKVDSGELTKLRFNKISCSIVVESTLRIADVGL
jgi:WD40 repeat protein